jgi:hypothetical protein
VISAATRSTLPSINAGPGASRDSGTKNMWTLAVPGFFSFAGRSPPRLGEAQADRPALRRRYEADNRGKTEAEPSRHTMRSAAARRHRVRQTTPSFEGGSLGL